MLFATLGLIFTNPHADTLCKSICYSWAYPQSSVSKEMMTTNKEEYIKFVILNISFLYVIVLYLIYFYGTITILL